MVKPVALVIAALSVSLCTACAETEHNNFRNARGLVVGSDEKMAFCRDFRLTVKEAVQFLRKSKVITAKEMHDHYEYLPCYIKGTVDYDDRVCDFTIRAGGTTELVCRNGESYILACNSCEALLSD